MINSEVQSKRTLVSKYKQILRTYIEQRPSGLRQKLARTLGTHKSFISQITNPNDMTPIPSRHIQTIVNVCHLSDIEKERFISAYKIAHPLSEMYLTEFEKHFKTLELRIPILENEEKQKELEMLISETLERIVKLIR